MVTKLNWDYQTSGEYRADYKGLVIRAIRDDNPSNPFTDDDGHWPMLARPDGRSDRVTEYGKLPGLAIGAVLGRFSDHALIHDQKAIGMILSVTAEDIAYHADGDQPPRKWWTDAGALRAAFEDAIYDLGDSDRLEALEALYKILGVPVLNTTVHGYCQGDQVDLLIVATPEAQKQFMGDDYFAELCDPLWDHNDAGFRVGARDVTSDRCPTLGEATTQFKARWAEKINSDLENQAKLYKAWAFGDVYGYQLARKVMVPPDDFEDDPQFFDETLEDLDGDTSCWGYYGSDFDWSGLEDDAIEAADYVLTKEAAHA